MDKLPLPDPLHLITELTIRCNVMENKIANLETHIRRVESDYNTTRYLLETSSILMPICGSALSKLLRAISYNPGTIDTLMPIMSILGQPGMDKIINDLLTNLSVHSKMASTSNAEKD